MRPTVWLQYGHVGELMGMAFKVLCVFAGFAVGATAAVVGLAIRRQRMGGPATMSAAMRAGWRELALISFGTALLIALIVSDR